MKLSREELETTSGLHFSVSMGKLGRKRYPSQIKVEGLGNGYPFELVRRLPAGEGAFYRQSMGVCSISILP